MTSGEIREKALELGFGDVGFTGTEPFADWAAEMARRIAAEPDMRAVWEGYRLSADPLAVMREAKTVVVLAWPHVPYTGDWPQGYLRWSAYYECRGPARNALAAFVKWLGERGVHAVEANDRLPLKAAAQRAGVGTIGLHQVLITPRWGSCVWLGAVLIDEEIQEARPESVPLHCQRCRRCVVACPTGAFAEDGTFHRERCRRHHMLSGDVIPVEFRGCLGIDLVGCDACQAVCPRNLGQYKEERYPDPGALEAFEIRGILTEWETGLKDRLSRMAPVIGANYARAHKVLSAALIASRDVPGLAEAVGRALRHPHPAIRRYAAWALGYREEPEAADILRDALATEQDAEVREEITAALDRRAHAGR